MSLSPHFSQASRRSWDRLAIASFDWQEELELAQLFELEILELSELANANFVI